MSEWSDGVFGSTPGVNGTAKRDGSYGMQVNHANNNGYALKNWGGGNVDDDVYIRLYLKIHQAPSSSGPFLQVANNSDFIAQALLKVNNDRSLSLFRYGGVQVGGNSDILALDTFYRVEMHIDTTKSAGSDILEARLNGVSFASANNLTFPNKIGRLLLGEDSAMGANRDLYFDTFELANGGYPAPVNEFVSQIIII